mgnify:CR=1 FL=1
MVWLIDCLQLFNLSSDEAALIARFRERPIKELLCYRAEGRLVNRKNLVILEDHHLPLEQPEEPLQVIGG